MKRWSDFFHVVVNVTFKKNPQNFLVGLKCKNKPVQNLYFRKRAYPRSSLCIPSQIFSYFMGIMVAYKT